MPAGGGSRHRYRDDPGLRRLVQVRLPSTRWRRHRDGACLHALPGPRQHQEDVHVPQGPQEADSVDVMDFNEFIALVCIKSI